jgi:hypothetical protein
MNDLARTVFFRRTRARAVFATLARKTVVTQGGVARGKNLFATGSAEKLTDPRERSTCLRKIAPHHLFNQNWFQSDPFSPFFPRSTSPYQ